MNTDLKHSAPTLFALQDKANPFKVPKNYFETVETNTFSALKQPHFKTPELYFETVEDAVFKALDKDKKGKVIVLNQFSKWLLASAAVVLLYFAIPKATQQQSLSSEAIIAYLEENNLDEETLYGALDDARLGTAFNTLDNKSISTYLEEDLDNLDLE